MTTNFPGSVDAFTNPTSNDTLDNPPHDQQHADINDAMEAVQTSLLDGSPLKIDDANNRVGIGTTSPSTTLHVDGSILANDSVTIGDGGDYVAGSIYSDANWGMIFRAKQASPAQADFRWANSADTERMRIDSSGNVGINDSTPSYKLDVNGDINAQGYARSKGKTLGMALITSGGLGGGTTNFTNVFSSDWTHYRIIVDPVQNGSTVGTYFRFINSSGSTITTGYYQAGHDNGTFFRTNNGAEGLFMYGSYVADGGAIFDITTAQGSSPSFHQTSTGFDVGSSRTYDYSTRGFCKGASGVTGIQFFFGSPYGGVYIYGVA